MSTRVAPLGLRLFLEGVEVPVIAANVTVQPDQPATAAIQIIPTDMSLNFLPRTLVHLFYLDAYLTDQELAAAQKVADKTANIRTTFRAQSNIMDRSEGEDFSYKLLFTGEVIGFNYRKTSSGRQLVLQCMDLSSYWDTCYQFFSDYSAAGNGLTDSTHQFVGAGSGIFDNLGGHQWVISNLINSAPKSVEYRSCKGLQGGLIHLLEAVGGLRYRSKDFKGYRGVNDFFTIAELRYGLLSMLGAIASDHTSAQLYASKAFTDWIRNGMTSIGNLISFRDMLNHINRYIFHNIYPNPCAKYKPGGEATANRTVSAGTTTFLDSPRGPAIKADLTRTLTSMVLTINALEKESVLREVHLIDPALKDIHSKLESNIKLVESSKGSNSSQVSEGLRSVDSEIRLAIGQLPVDPLERIGEDLSTSIQGVLGNVRSAHAQLYDLLSLDVARRRVESFKVPEASFLYNQLFLPEVFFVSPPRCNVIFPDQYFDLNFSRNFMREITRLSSTGGLGLLGGGRQGAHLFNTSYLAPAIKDVNGKLLLATMSQGARVLLPHEVHSGIIPKFEWVTDGHRWGVKAQKNRKGPSGEPVDKIFYLQRLANFQFFLHRWSARQLAVTGIFNPNIVAGLPGVVIDRSAPSPAVMESLEKILRRRMLPTQFVGKIFGYSHSIGQQGGSTSIQFAYARTHRGLDDEFLGTLSREIVEESAAKSFVVNPRELAEGLDSAQAQEEQDKARAEFTDKLKAAGAAASEVLAGFKAAFTLTPVPEGQTASAETVNARAKTAAKVSPNTEIRKSVVRIWTEKKLKPGVFIPKLGKAKSVTTTGVSKLNQSMSSVLGISQEYFDQNKKVSYFREPSFGGPALAPWEYAIDVPSKITISYVQVYGGGKYERTGQSFENAVRPDWISESVWANENITKEVYEPLLGSMAITDDVSLGQEQQDELLKRWEVDQTSRVTNEDGSTGTVKTQSVDNVYKYAVAPGSAEESIDGLSLVYGMIKERGGNVHEFIREFTRRPIANIVDILGTQNLEFDEVTGAVVDPQSMIEGFHSRAFGDYNTDVQLPEKEGSTTKAGKSALGALMDLSNASKEDQAKGVAGLERPGLIGRDEKKSGIRPELDPRGRARGRVRAYVEELQLSRGLLGS